MKFTLTALSLVSTIGLVACAAPTTEDVGEAAAAIASPNSGQAASVLASAAIIQSANPDLAPYGISVDYTYAPQGLYDKPFALDFTGPLALVTGGAVQVKTFATYIVGNFTRDHGADGKLLDVNNTISPKSKWKDAWFGAYFVVDDPAGKGRAFMLNNPAGDPSSLANLKASSLLAMPAYDQAVINWSSHAGQAGYGMAQFAHDFHATVTSYAAKGVALDAAGKSFLRLYAEADTIAALTDTSITNMPTFGSFAGYLGLPTEDVYKQVQPWHSMTLKGETLTSYFDCGAGKKFWAIAFYNGSRFTTKDGITIDTWSDTDIQAEYAKAFQGLHISCAN